ncbi:hypothetical protein [Gilliamella sp. CG16]|uniref:hypothetical protein n=1 Tax=Gilliamella sp. CG16 TaxID=3351503 RepID=UPI003986B460
MARRRSRGRFHSAAKRNAPGKSFWLRPPAFTLTEQQNNSATFSDVILAEDDFQDPSIELNDTMKGAPVLERLIIKCGFAQTFDSNYFLPAGFGQVTMLVEAMVFTQEDQFTTLVANTTEFDLTLRNNRILGYGVMDYTHQTGARTASVQQMDLNITFEPKTRVKLREKSLGVAVRGNFNLGNAASLANFVWCQPTMLVRVP